MEDSSAEGLRQGRLVAAPTSAYFWPARVTARRSGVPPSSSRSCSSDVVAVTGHLSVAHALDDDQPLIVHPRRWKEMRRHVVGPGCRQRGVQVRRVGHRLVEDRRERRPVEGHDVKSVRARARRIELVADLHAAGAPAAGVDQRVVVGPAVDDHVAAAAGARSARSCREVAADVAVRGAGLRGVRPPGLPGRNRGTPTTENEWLSMRPSLPRRGAVVRRARPARASPNVQRAASEPPIA